MAKNGDSSTKFLMVTLTVIAIIILLASLLLIIRLRGG